MSALWGSYPSDPTSRGRGSQSYDSIKHTTCLSYLHVVPSMPISISHTHEYLEPTDPSLFLFLLLRSPYKSSPLSLTLRYHEAATLNWQLVLILIMTQDLTTTTHTTQHGPGRTPREAGRFTHSHRSHPLVLTLLALLSAFPPLALVLALLLARLINRLGLKIAFSSDPIVGTGVGSGLPVCTKLRYAISNVRGLGRFLTAQMHPQARKRIRRN